METDGLETPRTPYEEAKWCFGEFFDAEVEYYMQNGFVYSGSDAFAMAIPHSSSSLMGQNLNKEIDMCDCWFVQFVSGRLDRLIQLLDGLPYDFDKIVFERDDEDIRFSEEHRYKCYDLSRLRERIHGKS